MIKLLILFLLLPVMGTAQTIIYTPGKAPVFVQQNSMGYTVNSMTDGVTQVLNLPGFKYIQPSHGPSTFIIGDSPEPVPVIPMEPVAPNMGVGLPTGPNGEYEI